MVLYREGRSNHTMFPPASRMAPFCRLKGPRMEGNQQQQEWRAVMVWSVCAVANGAEGGSARATMCFG